MTTIYGHHIFEGLAKTIFTNFIKAAENPRLQ
jgi:hypothetical protein